MMIIGEAGVVEDPEEEDAAEVVEEGDEVVDVVEVPFEEGEI